MTEVAPPASQTNEAPPPLANGKGEMLPPLVAAPTPQKPEESKPDPTTARKQSDVVKESLKRLKAIERAGEMVSAKNAAMAKQETVVANTKAKLDDDRKKYNALLHERDELQEDLNNIATGGFAERLDFPDPAKPKSAPAAASKGSESLFAKQEPDDNAWRLVPLDTLEPKISAAVLKAMADNRPSLTTLGELADFSAGKSKKHGGNNELKDIAGVGPAKAEQVEKATDAFWEKRRREAAKQASSASASDTQPLAQAMGKKKPKKKAAAKAKPAPKKKSKR